MVTSKNGSGKAWYTLCMPYHNVVYGSVSISSSPNTINYKYPEKEAMGILWNNSRSLIYRVSFRKWDNGVTLQVKPLNFNAHLLLNGPPEYVNILIRKFQ